MNSKKIFLAIAISIGLSACTEKPVKLVIDAPAEGEQVHEGSKVLYQVEDRATGKNETVTIPVAQVPQRLVIEEPHPKTGEPIPSATLADKKFIKDAEAKSPSMSYLKGVEGVEKLYREQKYRDALIHLAPLIEEYPSQAKLHVMQGTIYKKIGEKKLAYQAYKRAVAIDKDNLRVQQAFDKLQAEVGETN